MEREGTNLEMDIDEKTQKTVLIIPFLMSIDLIFKAINLSHRAYSTALNSRIIVTLI